MLSHQIIKRCAAAGMCQVTQRKLCFLCVHKTRVQGGFLGWEVLKKEEEILSVSKCTAKEEKKSFSFLLKSLSLNNNDHKQQTVVTKEQKKALKCTTPKQTKDNYKVDMT